MTEPTQHGDPAAELRAALDACGLIDRSALARLIGTGPDLLDLLHRLSTGDVRGLHAGQGRPTVLTTHKGRIVERLFVSHLGEPGVLLCAGSGAAGDVSKHLQRYTFAEQTGLTDAGATTCQFALVGPRAAEVLRGAGIEPPEPYQVRTAELAGKAAFVLGHDGLSPEGFSLSGAAEDGGALYAALAERVAEAGGRSVGPEAAGALRVLRGQPARGTELNEEHNPLEAGLWDAVSFDKGCYVGQEVVARLKTYDKVSQTLLGLRLPGGAAAPAPGTPLLFGGRASGRVTSALTPPGWSHAVGMAYVKRQAAGPGDAVVVGEPGDGVVAELVELPFAGG